MLPLSYWLIVAAIRFPTGTEAIAGLTFIAWPAALTCMKMSGVWNYVEEF